MISHLAPHKQDFLNTAISAGVLRFGEFELKSGRISPYFFNAGLLQTSRHMAVTADAFSQTIVEEQQKNGLEFDIIYGPAYKGIPLASIISVRLGQLDAKNLDSVSYSYDRKEAKLHGEGGSIVGAPLKGKKCLIVDDVITAGTAKREAIDKIQREGGIVAGIIVAVDRMEKLPAADGDDSKPGPSALGELKKEYGIPIFAVLTLDDIIEGMKSFASEEEIQRTEAYRAKYKATD